MSATMGAVIMGNDSASLPFLALDSQYQHAGNLSIGVEIPRTRLSRRHGATRDMFEQYMCELEQSLRGRMWGWGEACVRSVQVEELEACYAVGDELGRGHYGTVRACEDLATGERFACKTIWKESIQKEDDVKELCAEVRCMLRAHGALRQGHQGIVQLHEILEDEDAFHMVMDLCEGGDLFDHIVGKRRLSEREAAHIMRQIVNAVQHMHLQGLIHRDLKPENIMLTRQDWGIFKGRPHVKVGDFGLSLEVGEGGKGSGLAGSPFYMAPEVLRGEEYDREVDVWSLGVILYTALSGFLPFYGKERTDIFAAVQRAKPDFARRPWQNVSAEAKALVRAMLTPDPPSRISLHGVLSHPWMLHHCSDLRESVAAPPPRLGWPLLGRSSAAGGSGYEKLDRLGLERLVPSVEEGSTDSVHLAMDSAYDSTQPTGPKGDPLMMSFAF